MPIPKPKDGESQDDFIERCMGNDSMEEDYPDNDQRLAICFDSWRKAKGEKKMEERGAIGGHKTGTSDAAWDGPANEARLKLDQEAGYYRKAYAWQDPDGDSTKKNAYRFIHHEVSGEGTVGAANIRACQTGIGVLNGARGGTTIPGADRRGTYNHMAGHLRDADVEPAELKSEKELDSMPPGYERRSYPIEELRILEEDGMAKITGYAAVFNKLSEPLAGFREKIAPGAFRNALKNSDARALFNHDPNIVLGRQSAGTLTLSEDKKGLRMEVTPPDTQYVRDVVLTPIRRGDIKEQSFGFLIKTEEWSEEKEGGMATRTLVEVDRLFDVSPVTFPAYPDTSVALRSLEEWRKEREQEASQPEPEGTLDDGDEDVTSADVDKTMEDLGRLDTRLREIEISDL